MKAVLSIGRGKSIGKPDIPQPVGASRGRGARMTPSSPEMLIRVVGILLGIWIDRIATRPAWA
ncbi:MULTISPECIES: hypothetical protein [unclassified Bradyrhizobium]|uniref:hypothetical protein n=1 Tax=unclassified Bradyrhizobium TaxID=2631580 RepID=UPI0028E3B2C8|nr:MULTISPECIES: hypothetical protein [unclassified Bradyrhizobium]